MKKLVVFIFASLAAVGCNGIKKQNSEVKTQPFQPVITRNNSNGYKTYQYIQIGNNIIHSSGDNHTLSLNSDLFELTQHKDTNGKAKGFHISLNESQQSWSDGYGGMFKPDAKSTVYYDLDGDTVLDTMHKNGSKLFESYILHNNKWTRIIPSKLKWSKRKTTCSYDRKSRYQFVNGLWLKVQ